MRQVGPSLRAWQLVELLDLHEIAMLVANDDVRTEYFASLRSGVDDDLERTVNTTAGVGSPDVVESRQKRAEAFVATLEYLEVDRLTPTRLLKWLPYVLDSIPCEWLEAIESGGSLSG